MQQSKEELVRQTLGLPPGTEIEFVHTKTNDAGELHTESHGVGAGVSTSADDIAQKFSGSPPSVGVTTATGGDSNTELKAHSTSSLGNPLLWGGILCIVLAGVVFYRKGPSRAMLVLLAVGALFIASAFFPGLMLFLLAGSALLIGIPYVMAEDKANRTTEALRAVVGGVGKTKGTPAYEQVKKEIAAQADPTDVQVIDEIKRKDNV